MMDPEAELADFMPHNNSILLLEGPKATPSTCDNTDVLRMEGPMADDAGAFDKAKVLDISTNSLGKPNHGIHHTQCAWLISSWPPILP